MEIINQQDFSNYTKKELTAKAKSQASEDVDQGLIDPLKNYLYAKTLINYLTAYANEIHEAAIQEYDQFGEKDVSLLNRTITKSETGVKYDFSNSNHPKLKSLVAEQEKITSDIKEVEKMLKGLNEPMTIIDEDTGEMTEIKPPVKRSTTKIKVTY